MVEAFHLLLGIFTVIHAPLFILGNLLLNFLLLLLDHLIHLLNGMLDVVRVLHHLSNHVIVLSFIGFLSFGVGLFSDILLAFVWIFRWLFGGTAILQIVQSLPRSFILNPPNQYLFDSLFNLLAPFILHFCLLTIRLFLVMVDWSKLLQTFNELLEGKVFGSAGDLLEYRDDFILRRWVKLPWKQPHADVHRWLLQSTRSR